MLKFNQLMTQNFYNRIEKSNCFSKIKNSKNLDVVRFNDKIKRHNLNSFFDDFICPILTGESKIDGYSLENLKYLSQKVNYILKNNVFFCQDIYNKKGFLKANIQQENRLNRQLVRYFKRFLKDVDRQICHTMDIQKNNTQQPYS